MVDVSRLSEEMFYQIALKNFANFAPKQLEEPVSVSALALCALEDKFVGDDWDAGDGSKTHVADRIADMLAEKSDMLREYLAIVIDDERRLVGLPDMLQFSPEDGKLPGSSSPSPKTSIGRAKRNASTRAPARSAHFTPSTARTRTRTRTSATRNPAVAS